MIGCGIFQLIMVGFSIAISILTIAVIVWFFQVSIVAGILSIIFCEALAPAIVIAYILHLFGVL